VSPCGCAIAPPRLSRRIRAPCAKPWNAASLPPEADRERVERETYQRGFSEGTALGKQQAGAELQPVLERMGKCLAELASMRSGMRRDGERDLVKLSIAIARRVLHRELTLDPESIEGTDQGRVGETRIARAEPRAGASGSGVDDSRAARTPFGREGRGGSRHDFE